MSKVDAIRTQLIGLAILVSLIGMLVMVGGIVLLLQGNAPTVVQQPTLVASVYEPQAGAPASTAIAAVPEATVQLASVTPVPLVVASPAVTASLTVTPSVTATATMPVGSIVASTAAFSPSQIPVSTDVLTAYIAPTVEAIVVVPPGESVPDVVIVRVDPSQVEQLQADVAAQGGTVELVDEALGAVTIQLPTSNALEQITQAEYVEASEPDYFVTVQQSAVDPLTAQQWSLSAMKIPVSVASNRRSVKVAVVDSGVCANHPELMGKVIGGYDFVEGDATPQDEMGHGCAVAGVIAAGHNGMGMMGVASNAELLIYRVLNAQGSGRYSHLASAIVRAVDDGAGIINLSLGGSNASQLLQDAIAYAQNRGVVVVASSGNNGSSSVLYPARYEGVVSVGATGRDFNPAVFSNYGKVDVWAPGVEVLSLTVGGDYATFNGTSFAAPNLSGLIALTVGEGAPITVRGGGFALYRDPTLVALPTVTPEQSPTPTITPTTVVASEKLQGFYTEIEQNGSTSVIVGLAGAFSMSADPSFMAQQQVQINALRDGVIASLSTFDVEILSLSNEWAIPALALQVDRAALDMLASSIQISYIVKNGVSYPTMDSSLQAIGVVPTLRNLGYYGAGNPNNAVAVLDTGVDYDHAFLSGKLLSGACFSGGGNSANSLCPNGATNQTGNRAAHISRCTTLGVDCAHGTHVSGTVVGQNSGGLQGVAPQSKVFPIQVFTTFSGDLGAYDSDIIAGLNHVYQQNSNGTIRTIAVNMSLGGWGYTSYCDYVVPATTQVIQLLRAANIATVIASGNSGSGSSVSYPACISSAISVGAMTDSFAVASFSNRASFLTLYAPGVSITSAVPGGGYAAWQGTSMAAPHVAGAFALLNPYRSFTVDQVLNALRSTGPGLGTYNTPRIRLDLAASALYGIGVPTPTPLPTLPNDGVTNAIAITTSPYTYNMNTVLATDDFIPTCANSGKTVWWKYTPTSSGNLTLNTLGSDYDTVAAIWTGTPPSNLTQVACNDDVEGNLTSLIVKSVNAGTTYYLQVGGYYGAVGNLTINMQFTPTAPVPTSPINGASVTTLLPSLTWSNLSGATGYEVRYGLSNPPTRLVAVTTNTYVFVQPLAIGTWHWQVRAKDSQNQWGVWSDVATFNLDSATGGAPRPAAQVSGTVTFTWNPQSWVQGYQVQVSSNSSFTAIVYQSATLPSGTSSDSTTISDGGTYYWRVRGLVNGTTWGSWSTTQALIVR